MLNNVYIYELRGNEAIIRIINGVSLFFDAVGPWNPNVGPHVGDTVSPGERLLFGVYKYLGIIWQINIQI